jgi:transketolase
VAIVSMSGPTSGFGCLVVAPSSSHSALAESGERPPVVQLAVREMPHSGKGAELLHEAAIDADAIAQAAREIVRSHA